MVMNLCLPHFYTTVHCNKLCADGYDVTNLLSADPVLRRRGFKLEYFLRPPVQVTLKFGFEVELCRVDVELFPWGMDRGQACKRLEISTSSDPRPSQNFCESNTDSSNPEPEFKLVGRCELREETQICFTRSSFSPRPPFLSQPPPQPANCRQEELWSRGLLSVGAVTQLRVNIPCGGAASALGLKALAVWGQPARCCPAEEVERIKRVHEANERQLLQPVLFDSSVRKTKQPPQTATPPSSLSIPQEFLDPITQEIMTLPMLLPSGVSVDSTTLEEYQKREATWGRAPNDPFTGVPFTSTSQPLPNPQLKSRIDHFVLQKENPQASRLIASKVEANADIKYGKINSFRTTQMQETESGNSSDNGNNTSSCQPVTTEDELKGDKRRKQDLSGVSNHSAEESTAEKQPLPQTCSACSCSVSVYSTSASSIYRLTCGHLLCHACLQREPQPRNSVTTSTTNQILCPACHSPTARTDVIRVHY
uniref:U-box domain containing 5 n=1 Tax=Anabas testudineus TaxID=64144 RepID=A0A7N6C1Q4_ANATE